MAKSAIIAKGFIDIIENNVNYHENEALIIEEGRMLGFVERSNLPDEITLIDFSDTYCLPGLIDTAFLAGLIVSEDGSRPDSFGESAWQALQAANVWLMSGVTTAASMGAVDNLDYDLQRSINNGRLKGTRICPALSPLVPVGASNFHSLYGVREVSGSDDARRAVRELIKNGAERIVIYADVPLEFHTDPHETSRHRLVFSMDELCEMVEQARQAGCFVHAQTISKQAIDNCIQAGVRSIGCAFGLQEEHIALLVEKGIALAPNLALGATIREKGPSAGFSAGMIDMVSRQRIAPELLVLAHQAGVNIICGTNTAFLAGDVARECIELHRAGLSTIESIRAGTQNAAATLKPYVECGSYHPHYFANLVFVETDPIKDLQALNHIHGVMFEGTIQ